MKSDERFITKILDDGGPFVIWEKEKKGTFKRGMILDTWVCDIPDVPVKILLFQKEAGV